MINCVGDVQLALHGPGSPAGLRVTRTRSVSRGRRARTYGES